MNNFLAHRSRLRNVPAWGEGVRRYASMLSAVSLGPAERANMLGCGAPSTQFGLARTSIHRISRCESCLTFLRRHSQKTRRNLRPIRPETPMNILYQSTPVSGPRRAQADGNDGVRKRREVVHSEGRVCVMTQAGSKADDGRYA